MIEQKTTLPSLKNQELKKVNIETEELNKWLIHNPKCNIAELNELIYAGATLLEN